MPDLEPHYRDVPPEQLPKRQHHPLHVVLENIRSAFNVGSIFRTSDAAAVAQLHLWGYTAHPPNGKLAKTALGSMDYVPWSHTWDIQGAIAALKAANIPIVGIETQDDAPAHHSFTWPRPVALVFGNEVGGIDSATLAQCDHVVQIPMQGYKKSINVATACGIVVFEILRQWEACSTETLTAPELAKRR
ncbi:MAG: RNA methyltransferase [Candidatus Lernaella stagnicola]|nr:RNA methyltransferase [Candidatus Lernaella stagnicola]